MNASNFPKTMPIGSAPIIDGCSECKLVTSVACCDHHLSSFSDLTYSLNTSFSLTISFVQYRTLKTSADSCTIPIPSPPVSKSNYIYTALLPLMYLSAVGPDNMVVAMLSVAAFLTACGGNDGSTFWDKFGP